MSVIYSGATDAEIASMGSFRSRAVRRQDVFLKIPNGIIIDAVLQPSKAEDAGESVAMRSSTLRPPSRS